MDEIIEWGRRLDILAPEQLESERARRLGRACLDHPAFEILGFRRVERDGCSPLEVIVVRCTNHEVPNRNRVGIRVRETLGLAVPLDDQFAPEVRALRCAFPTIPHLNAVFDGEPKSLCLIVESWSATRLTWTPQRFLSMTLWWLKEAASETLHLPNQPVERVYFDLGYELILPPGYTGAERQNLRLAIFTARRGHRFTLVAFDSAEVHGGREHVPLYLQLERVHGTVDWMPLSLGRLVDQWAQHGVVLGARLVDDLRRRPSGVQSVDDQSVVLILDVGLVRNPGGVVERRDLSAFLIRESIVSLAYKMGAFYRQGRVYYVRTEFESNVSAEESREQWGSIPLMPLDVRQGLTAREAREQAGIDDGGDVERVLLGLGALGSALAETWAREGWGRWTYVDPDHVLPHNLVRHRATYTDLGRYKVEAVKEMLDGLTPTSESRCVALPVSATRHDEVLKKALSDATLVVDASTTLEVPRELSSRSGARRMCSAFITPNGRASVLLLEDAERRFPLDVLEAQYYRQLLRTDWGETHLSGHLGVVAVGAGCRDISTVMSPEMVELHAAILARQIRVLSQDAEGTIRVWSTLNDGAVSLNAAAPVVGHRYVSEDSWNVVIDDEVIETMRRMRAARLPTETGGIIVGYTDHVSRTIYVVDAHPAPVDSVEEDAGFVRGKEGLPALWKQTQERTAMIVNYIGEWHSHPKWSGAAPSWDDLSLVAHLGHVLAADGDPALMVIVAEQELSLFVCQSDGKQAAIAGVIERRHAGFVRHALR